MFARLRTPSPSNHEHWHSESGSPINKRPWRIWGTMPLRHFDDTASCKLEEMNLQLLREHLQHELLLFPLLQLENTSAVPRSEDVHVERWCMPTFGDVSGS